MAALKLLEDARSAGLKLHAEGDRLVIRGPKSAEPIAKALLDRKAEILPFLREPRPFHEDSRETDLDQSQEANTWLCPHCDNPASIDDVDWSLDGERRLTFWSCAPCQIIAVTPSDIKEPPTCWVKRAEQ